MKAIELFAGAGGLGLGVGRAGFKAVDVVEWDRWCCDTLRENRARGSSIIRHWPEPREGDVRGFSFTKFEGKIDLVTGGPPCQPFSLGDAIPPFEGAGIYVIYYSGAFPAYAPIAAANAEEARWPIYIGKAVPSGNRKGASLAASGRGTALCKRLAEHRDSIRDAEQGSGTLAVADFQARYLTVDDIWIPLGESLLIARFFRPIWNVVLDGFGNHDPGKGVTTDFARYGITCIPAVFGRSAARCAPKPSPRLSSGWPIISRRIRLMRNSCGGRSRTLS